MKEAAPVVAVLVAGSGLTLWLGLYLLAREPGSPLFRRAAAGLVGYAAALAFALLVDSGPDGGSPAGWLDRLLLVAVCVPAVAWTGACLRLLPESYQLRQRLDRLWLRVVVPVSAFAVVPAAVTGGLPDDADPPGPAYLLAGTVLLAPLLAVLVLLVRTAPAARIERPAPVGPVLAVATLMFGLGAALLAVPAGWPSRPLLLAAVDLDLLALGVAVAWCAAFDAGETLRRDMLRSLLAATAAVVLFGGQVVLVMLAGPGATPTMTALLLGTVAAAVAVQVLAGPAHGLLDRLAFAATPWLARERAQLRSAEAAVARRDDNAIDAISTVSTVGPDRDEFVRLTRRALSNYGDLAKLTASPLVNLPVIHARLAARDAAGHPLERAAELKALLLESIRRLKPTGGEFFGTTEEWRYYNALFFPYVLGLRPYRRSADRRRLGPDERRVFDWFASQVPERTLHNWQNAAARLVADDLIGSGAWST